MKSKKLLLSFLAIAATILLVGCTESPAATPQTQNNTPGAAQTSNGNNAADNQQISLADQAAYNGALQLKDPTFCDKIISVNLKAQCQTALSNKKITEDAIAKVDPKICEQLSTPDLQQACKTQIEVMVAEKKKDADLQSAYLSDQNLDVEIMKSGDYTRCQELKEDKFHNECEITLLSNKAIASKDPKLCEKASTAEIKDQCTQIFGKMSALNQ